MTALEEKLLETGNALARSVGHRFARGCPKVSAAVPCTCGAEAEQAKALAEWDRLAEQIREQ